MFQPETAERPGQEKRVTRVRECATKRSLPSSVKSIPRMPLTPLTEKGAPARLDAKS